jgi:glycosyltransferase involved in cell wall biosynthesis
VRVLLVSQEYPPETAWGGIGTYAGTIAPALVRAGAEVHVLSVVRGQERTVSTREGVHIHRAPLRRIPGVGRAMPATWQRVSLAAGVALETRRLSLDFDVCEAPEWNAESLLLSFGKTPQVVRVHSGARQVYPVLGPLNRDRRTAIRLEERSIRRAAVVIGTRSLLREVTSALAIPPSRTRTIICPVPRTEPLPPPSDGPPTVAFIGRFEARKGPDTLVRAVPAIAARIPNVRVVLRGTDTLTVDGASVGNGLRELARALGVGDRVEIIDRWRPGAVREELRSAHVCAVPSRWESFGLVAAEAGALGRAVVASRIPGLDEVIHDGTTGRLVAPDSPKALADAISDLLDSPETAAEMGAAAATDIGSRCDPDHVARETLDAYGYAIARSRDEAASR